jgi:glutathione S-transferase
MTGIVLYGFDGSTYVRTVRMLLAEKGAHYEQVPVNVLKGERRQPEHASRHPFGKVPVLDHGGFRIIETGAVGPYLGEVLPGPSFTPDSSKDRARMRMGMGIVDSYGYSDLIAVAGYHLFPDFIGGPHEEARKHGIVSSRRVLPELMKLRGGSAFIAVPRSVISTPPRSASSFHLPQMPTKSSRWMVSPDGGSRYRQCRATKRQRPV